MPVERWLWWVFSVLYKEHQSIGHGYYSHVARPPFPSVVFFIFMLVEKGLIQFLYTFHFSYSQVLGVTDWWLIGIDDYKG